MVANILIIYHLFLWKNPRKYVAAKVSGTLTNLLIKISQWEKVPGNLDPFLITIVRAELAIAFLSCQPYRLVT